MRVKKLSWVPVVLLALTACGHSVPVSDPVQVPTATVTVTTTVSPTVTATAAATVTATAVVTVTVRPAPEETPAPSASPVPGVSAQAVAAFLAGIGQANTDFPDLHVEEGVKACTGMVEAGAALVEQARYLVENRVGVAWDGLAPLAYLCAAQNDAIALAVLGFDDGDYTVGAGEEEIRPGKYRTAPEVTDCYWERVSDGGSTLANDFVTNAPKGVTVSIKSSDGGFSSSGCGVWLPVAS